MNKEMGNKLEVGQRIHIFEVTKPSGGYPKGNFKLGSWYSEVPGNQFHGNKFGRDMVSDNPDCPQLHCSISDNDIKFVGTMVVKELKKPKHETTE
jgi:hypothetical protein